MRVGGAEGGVRGGDGGGVGRQLVVGEAVLAHHGAVGDGGAGGVGDGAADAGDVEAVLAGAGLTVGAVDVVRVQGGEVERLTTERTTARLGRDAGKEGNDHQESERHGDTHGGGRRGQEVVTKQAIEWKKQVTGWDSKRMKCGRGEAEEEGEGGQVLVRAERVEVRQPCASSTAPG